MQRQKAKKYKKHVNYGKLKKYIKSRKLKK